MRTCWFCEERPDSKRTRFRVLLIQNSLTKIRLRSAIGGFNVGARSTRRTRDIEIPYCDVCAQAHDRQTRLLLRYLAVFGLPVAVVVLLNFRALLATVAASGFATLVGFLLGGSMLVGGVALLAWLFSRAHYFLRFREEHRGVKKFDAYRLYPSVASYLTSGWEVERVISSP